MCFDTQWDCHAGADVSSSIVSSKKSKHVKSVSKNLLRDQSDVTMEVRAFGFEEKEAPVMMSGVSKRSFDVCACVTKEVWAFEKESR